MYWLDEERMMQCRIHFLVEDMVLLPGNFIDSIYIYRMQGMSLVDWQVIWFSVHLSGASKYDSNFRVVFPTCFQNRQLCLGINVQVSEWILH